jgi:hypothetical protein
MLKRSGIRVILLNLAKIPGGTVSLAGSVGLSVTCEDTYFPGT